MWVSESDGDRLPCTLDRRLAVGGARSTLYRLTVPPVVEFEAAILGGPGRDVCAVRLLELSGHASGRLWRRWEVGAPGAPVDGEALAGARFVDLPQVVQGLVPRGLSVLAGRPKARKSWLALDVALCVASGQDWNGRAVERGPVLYVGLEDTYSRLRERLQVLGAPSAGLHTVVSVPGADEGERLGWLAGWCEAHRPVLVVVDTLQRWRDGKASTYHRDYKSAGEFKQLADGLGLALVVVHHTRKGKVSAGESPLDLVSGSSGLTGAADAVLVLGSQGDNGALFATGRDIQEAMLPLRWGGSKWIVGRGPPALPGNGGVRALTYRQ